MTASISDKLTDYGMRSLLQYMARKRDEAWAAADTSKVRLYYAHGVEHYDDQCLAYSLWLSLGKGVRCAFRGADDKRPVYPHDLVDRF